MNEEKTNFGFLNCVFELCCYVFLSHVFFSFIFADFLDKPMGAVSVFTNRNLSTANLTVRCCFVLSLFIYVVYFFVINVFS